MRHAFLECAIGDFEAQFGLQGLRGSISVGMPGEVWATVYVPGRPMPAMLELAQAIEMGYDDMGKTV